MNGENYNCKNENYKIIDVKNLSILLLLLYVGFFATSCRQNSLKFNERELAQQVIIQEKEKLEAERLENEKLLAESLASKAGKPLYKEDRSVDPANPPVIIDFSKEIPSKEIKLSDIGIKVSYIVLRIPDDSLYFLWGAWINFTSNRIIINNNLGIHSFNTDGQYIETIAKNYVDAPRNIDPEKPFSGFFPRETFQGAWINHVGTSGSTVFYKYTDYPGEKVSLLKHNTENGSQNILVPQASETVSPATYAKGEVIETGREVSGTAAQGLSNTNILPLSDKSYANIRSGVTSFKKNGTLMVTFNLAGDTLCKFTQYEYLKSPVTSSLIRSFSNSTWSFGNLTTIKWAFNDTVFRIIPPNRLIPTYIFNMGKYKMSVDDWLHINSSLDGKIKITEILENQKFLFIQYDFYTPGIKNPPSEYAIYKKNTNELIRVEFTEKRNKMYDFISSPVPMWASGFENDP